MRSTVWIAVAACLGGVDDGAEIKRFQGTWEMVSMTIVGQSRPGAARGRTVVIKGRNVTFMRDGKARREATLVLDPTTTPRQIDLTFTDAFPALGVYEFDGSTLKLCFFRNRRDCVGRPESLKSDEGHRTTVTVYKRR
jgi:uncharacterized protein (TIGR03067 family)